MCPLSPLCDSDCGYRVVLSVTVVVVFTVTPWLHSPSVALSFADTVGYISWSNVNNRKACGSIGCCEAVVTALMSHMSSEDVAAKVNNDGIMMTCTRVCKKRDGACVCPLTR